MKIDCKTILLDRLDYLRMTPFDKVVKASPHASVIRSILKGSSPTISNWAALCNFLGISIRHDVGMPDLMAELPVHGKVGAGGTVAFVPNDTTLDTVPGPVAYAGLAGLQVQGESMYPVYHEGDIVFVSDRTAALHEVIGRDCICELANDGGVFLKRVRHAEHGKPWVLESINPLHPPMQGVMVVRAHPIIWVRRF